MAGSSRKEENTMSVELAIQRELAYRRKVATFHMHPKIKSTQEILSLQVKPSCQVSHPMPLPGPSSRPSSSPCLSGTKRKEPTCSANYPPLHYQQQLFHGSLNHNANAKNLYCKICQVPCSSPFNLKQHLIGQKHRENLQKLEFSEKAGKEGRSNERQWCELCKVPCMNEELLKLHIQGRKHKAELQKLEISKQGGEAPNKPKWCELCKLWCIDEFAFKQHLEGKKHIVQMHAMEKEKSMKEKDPMAL